MKRKKSGQIIKCCICGAGKYRTQSQIKRGIGKTCGSTMCKSKYFSGKGNPFWGKKHTPESRQKIVEERKRNPRVGTGPKKGLFKHTESAKQRISEASKKLWSENREKMMACKKRGWSHANYKPPELRRYRKNFTPVQRREWKDDKCAYCDITDDLVLDHIIPVFDGGLNIEENSQTLCRGCNLWKVKHVDVPRYLSSKAHLDSQGG